MELCCHFAIIAVRHVGHKKCKKTKQHHESSSGFQFSRLPQCYFVSASPLAPVQALQNITRNQSITSTLHQHWLLSSSINIDFTPHPVIPVPSQVTGVTQIIGTSTSNASFREGTAASSVVWRRKVFNKRCQPWSSCNRDDQCWNGLLLRNMLLK